MTRYFKLVEITKEEFEEGAGEEDYDIGPFTQEVLPQYDGNVFIAIDDEEPEMEIDMELFE